MVASVELAGGRRMAYREQGVKKERAKVSLLVLHGLGSSRLAGIPGVRDEILEEFGVRMVAVDRPGTGQSDPDEWQTLRSVCGDLEAVMDALEMGKEVWLLGFSCGGAYAWAAAYFIPHRLAGLLLWAPVGNYWWEGITREHRVDMGEERRSTLMLKVGKYCPVWLSAAFIRTFVLPTAGKEWMERCRRILSSADRMYLAQMKAEEAMVTDNLESLSKSKGFGMAKDLAVVSSPHWGFQPKDVARVFAKPIHIWQGEEDYLVPLKLQMWIKEQIPQAIHLHVLEGQGHLSWFCFNDNAHREVIQMCTKTHTPL